ncbi:hypothetical protein O4H26_15425 [Aequorivita viscosa]|nr:hypothetical protein [Aequorivita viscosa]
MKNAIIFIFSIGILTSCSTLKKIKPNENLNISDSNQLELINGDYSIKRDSTCLGLSLDGAFEFKTEFNCINKADSTHFMRLTTLSEKKIRAELYHGNELLEEKILKGKLRKNYFVLNASLKFPIFYGVFNVYRSRKTRIGILPNGNLTLDNDTGGCGMLVIFPLMCAGNDSYGIEYKRLKASR